MPSNVNKTPKDAIVHPVNREDPPVQLLEFFRLYVEGRDPMDAWVEAGYSPNTKYQAKLRIRENWKVIEKLIDERIGSQVPLAIKTIVDIMVLAKSDQTKLLAAKDILSRAGKDKPIQVETSKKEPDKLEESDLDAEILELVKKIGFKDVG